MKILVTDNVEGVCADVLTQEGFEVHVLPTQSEEELCRQIGAYDALIVRSATHVTGAVIAEARNLKVIGRAGAGVDNIDVETATRRGIVVMNTPGGNTISTAEHTFSLLLSLARNVPQAWDSIRQGKWERKKFVGAELFGKTIGIIGLGKVGREVAVRARAFGMTVIGFDPVVSAEIALKMGVEVSPLDELFARADFITIHTPLSDETKGLIGEEALAKCKEGVRIINCARGGIVDEQALLKALDSGKVAGAALDVFEHEPPGDHPLLKHHRVVATPHLGASTEEAQEKVARQIAAQVADFLKERGIAGAVNADVVQRALKKEIRPFVLLAEKLGELQIQMLRDSLRRITVTCSGSFLSSSVELLAAAVLKGVFSRLMSEPVNLINAPIIARESGITVSTRWQSEHSTYTHLISVRFETSNEQRTLSGTVFGNAHLRIVEADGYPLEINPEGYLLFYNNLDKPGMLAKVGTILASAGINIAGLALGRDKPGEQALTIINVDSPIPTPVLYQIGSIEGVSRVHFVRI
jgi:D-3-phosphoglycerate dehydrogenase